jgi:hypothetical protein
LFAWIGKSGELEERYLAALRQPFACASASVQNQRSPSDGSI